MADIAIAFETKPVTDWDIPSWASTLKQAADYVLASVEPDLAAHAGKRVMATFVCPAPAFSREDAKSQCLYGMAHMASYHRVGMVKRADISGNPLALVLGPELWIAGRGWRSIARGVLVGKRQIGSQRFPIIDELLAMERGQ